MGGRHEHAASSASAPPSPISKRWKCDMLATAADNLISDSGVSPRLEPLASSIKLRTEAAAVALQSYIVAEGEPEGSSRRAGAGARAAIHAANPRQSKGGGVLRWCPGHPALTRRGEPGPALLSARLDSLSGGGAWAASQAPAIIRALAQLRLAVLTAHIALPTAAGALTPGRGIPPSPPRPGRNHLIGERDGTVQVQREGNA